MKTVRPKPLGTPSTNLPLSPEEGFVLSRIDGSLSVGDLVALTGIEQGRLEQIVTKLASHGAVQLDGMESSARLPEAPNSDTDVHDTASLADFASALGMDPARFGAQRPPPTRPEAKSDYPPPATTDNDAEDDFAVPVMPPAPLPISSLDLGGQDELIEVHDDDNAETSEIRDTAPEENDGTAASDGEEAVVDERNFRQLYESKFHSLPTDARVHAAQTTSGSDLMCLCLDADPKVIAGLLENPKAGLDHARLIAFHHRTGTGLEMLSRRMEFTRDSGVERRLLRNPQSGDVTVQRILASKGLLQVYKICMDRDVPDLTRNKTRGSLRKKWQSAPSEDRADFTLRTEGRALQWMTGCTFDARATAILCGKSINSGLFIQNLAKFPACPPALLAHLIKQPFVRKNVGLKRLLLQHPNMPGDAKRLA